MKIVIVMRIFNNQKGGKEVFTWNLVKKLLEDGHHVQIVASEFDEISHRNIEFYPVTVHGKSLGLHRWFFANNARQVVDDLDHDLCLTHGKAGFGDVIRIGGLPINRHLEVMAEEHDSALGSWWYRFRKKLSLSARMSLFLEQKSFTDNPDLRKIFVASSLIKDELLEGYPTLSSDMIEVIHNGYDPDNYNLSQRKKYRSETRRELGLGSRGDVGIFVGNDFRRKGFPTALEFLRTNEQTELIVVGRGENYRRSDLSGGLSNRIYWQGEVRNVEQYYAAADFLILPSKTDGFGLVVLEALAMGLYVFVSKNCGSAEIIQESWQGKIPEDWNELIIDDYRSKIFDDDLIKRRARSASDHTWSSVTEKYISGFKSILK